MRFLNKDKYTFTLSSPKHKHQCICGCIWEHGEECMDDVNAHTCLKCGNKQWFKYNGPLPVTPVTKVAKVVKDKYTFHL